MLVRRLLSIAFVCVVASFVFLTLPSQTQATVISYVSADLDEGSAWRTTTDSKPLDGDRDNVYGTDGWLSLAYSSNKHPAYGTIWLTSQSQASNSGYALIDDPLGSGNIRSGTTTSSSASSYFPSSGKYDAMAFTFEKADVSTKTIRIGLMTDNLDNSAYNSGSLTLRSRDTDASATVTLDATKGYDNVPDWYFFDVSGAASSDAFYVIGTPGPGGLVTVGAATLDTVVPEPTSLVLMTMGGVGLLAYAWRKRK